MTDDRWELWQGCTLLLALAELSDQQRHAVIGRYFRGLSPVELARERGVTKTAIYLNEMTGLDRLRCKLDPIAMREIA